MNESTEQGRGYSFHRRSKRTAEVLSQIFGASATGGNLISFDLVS